jgi:diguanylate cyclase (GGDEF)-like protein
MSGVGLTEPDRAVASWADRLAAGGGPRLQRLDAWFHARTSADVRLARSFTILHVAGPFFGMALCALLALTVDIPEWVLATFALGVSLFWALPFLVRSSGNIERPAFASVQLLVLLSLFLSYHFGGLNSPFAVWLVVAMLLTFLFAGRLVGWCLGAATVQLAAFVALLRYVPAQPLEGDAGTLFVASVTAATLYISFIAIFFARIRIEGSRLAAEAREHRQLAAGLDAAIAAAADDDRRRSAFLSKVSHELRTPLNVVIGYSEMLLEDALTGEEADRQNQLNNIIESGRSLVALIEDGTSLAQSGTDSSNVADRTSSAESSAGEAGDNACAAASPHAPSAAKLRARLRPLNPGLVPGAAALAVAAICLAIPGSTLAPMALACLAAAVLLLFWMISRTIGAGSMSGHSSDRDDLTGLFNRQAFQSELDRFIGGSAGEPVAMLFADLDGFKEVNDSLGHDAGDQLLRKVAERFAAAAPPTALIARLGGDEFGAAAFGKGAGETIRALADAWVEAIVMPIETDQDFLSVGVSIGIAEGRVGKISSRELLRRSDVAMYRAKADKRHPVQVFDVQMDEALSFRRTMRQDLAAAILEDQLQLALQPVVDARSGEIASAEALLRWTHPVLGPVSPAKLIPLAEESGQIISLDDWVLEQALRYARELPAVPIAVNVSPIQFRHPGLARKIVDRLQAYGVPARQLRLEITEGVLVTHTRAANRTILELREAGIGIALDDFGTGFSSLSYLKDFKFDFLKIDRSFVSDLSFGRRTGAELLRAIVDLGHSLDMRVVAEGVETAGQASIIQLLGCDYIQGYFTGRPMSFDQLKERLAAGARAATTPQIARA